jgi:hypothetical protein
MSDSINLAPEVALLRALRDIRADIESDDDEGESELDAGEAASEADADLHADETVAGILSLADIPLEQWDNIKVSPISRFRENKWDFTCYPHVNKKQAILNLIM